MPACASLLSGMETSPSQGVEVLVLADQDFEDMFLADTQARLSDSQGARPCFLFLSITYHLVHLSDLNNLMRNVWKIWKNGKNL